MNPKQYEWMAIERVDALRREAAGSHVLARAHDGDATERRPFGDRLAVRDLVERLARVRHRLGIDIKPQVRGSVGATKGPADSR
jgi:hypothetical protein